MALLDLSAKRQWQAATGVAALALVLVIVNSTLVLTNESHQAEVNQRQQFINQSIQLSRISQSLVTALAQAAVRSDDKDIREMLASSGYTIQQTNSAPQANAPAAAPTAAPSAQATPGKPAGK